MFGRPFDDVIDPFAEEANAWGESKPFSPSKINHEDTATETTDSNNTQDFNLDPDYSKQCDPAAESESHYQTQAQAQTHSYSQDTELDQSSHQYHDSSRSHNNSTETPTKLQKASPGTKHSDIDDHISKEFDQKVTVSGTEQPPKEDTQNGKEESPILLINNRDSPVPRRPILFQRNKNKTRVLLSNKAQSASNDFIDPLTESQLQESPKNSPNRNQTSTRQTLNKTQAQTINSPVVPHTNKNKHNIFSSNNQDSPSPAYENQIHFNPFGSPDLNSSNSFQNPAKDSINPTNNFQQDENDDSDYQSGGIEELYPGGSQNRSSPTTKVVVSEPIKVTDSLSSHTVYKVSTQTSSRLFKAQEFSVRRRYRDFEWLYQQLYHENPGVIIPPIPEKQSFGRFEQYFIENRRIGLQVHLDRVLAHPTLSKSRSLILFLESEDFSAESKAMSDKRQEQVNMGSSFGDIFGSNKYLIKNDPFSEKFKELELIESHLKALMKSLETTNKQHEELSLAHIELGEAFFEMSKAENEFSSGNHLADLSKLLMEMGKLQKKLETLQGKMATKTKDSLVNTTEEYIRTINSSRNTFTSRVRAYNRWKNYESELERQKRALNHYSARIAKYKLNNGQIPAAGLATIEKVNSLKTEIERTEIAVDKRRQSFDSVSQLLSNELERFDWLRVESFQKAVESYLVSMIEIQDEVVNLWDMFTSMFESST